VLQRSRGEKQVDRRQTNAARFGLTGQASPAFGDCFVACEYPAGEALR
jgi:hypothetical protein